MAADQLEGQILDDFNRVLSRLDLLVLLGRCIQEQHILRAHDGLVALLPALAILPRACLQTADYAHPAALVHIAPTLLGQLVPSLDSRPVGLEHALARLAPTRQPLGCHPEATDRHARWNDPLLRLCPNPADQLHPIDCAFYLLHLVPLVTNSSRLRQPRRLTLSIPPSLKKRYGVS